jgi:hypothetical protein
MKESLNISDPINNMNTFLLFSLGGLGSLACSHSQLILKLRMLPIVVGAPWTGDQPVARIPTQNKTNIE